MSEHPEEGRLQAYLDGEVPREERDAVTSHLRGCPDCRGRLEELERLERLAARALAGLEGPTPPVEAALWEVRRRRAARRSRDHRRRLAAAAVIVLLVGSGAAAAVPGSPLRAWIEDQLRPDDGPVPTVLEAPEEPAAERPGEAGVVVSLLEGAVTVSFRDVPEGAWLEVVLGAEGRAGVFAPPASRFESGAGRVQVDVRGPGDVVRVELPRDARVAEIRVNEEVLLRKTDRTFLYPGPPPADTLEGRVRIRVPGPPGAPSGEDRNPDGDRG